MADEVEPGLEAEPETAPEEGQDQEQPKSVEDLATELGWKPKEEWQGDESLWQPADQFLRAPRERRDNLTREVRGLRDQLDRVVNTSSQLMADKIAERDSYWRQVQAKAVEDGDQDAVERAVQERAKLKQAPPADDVPPETADFMERNKAWFGKDPLATLRAKQIAAGLAQDGIPIPDQLRQAERAIRKEFPELFPTPAKQPAALQTGQSRNASTGSRAKGFADMPEESRKLAQEYKDRHGIPLEKFAESYWTQETKRRVG